MGPRRLLLGLLPVLIAARAGRADTLDAKERRARTACLAGDPTLGVRLLSELFVATEDATFIYNQGRCFEQNRRYEDAIARFQEFLRAGKKLTNTVRAQARKHIDDCKELLAAEKSEKSQATQAAAMVPPMPPSGPTTSTVVAAPATPPVQTDPQERGSAGRVLRTTGIVTASAGGAALAAAIIFNLKVNGLARDLKGTDGYSADKESDRTHFQTLGWVGYSVGTACVATGAILYGLGLSSERGRVALMPELAPRQAGVVVRGAF
jgi:hypothetical protein